MKTGFQVFISGLFIFFILAGVGFFAFQRASQTSIANVPLTVWGTVSSRIFEQFVNQINTNLGSDAKLKITYYQKTADTFDTDLAEAIATGAGPDIVLISQDLLLKVSNKLITIPFTAYSQQTFNDTFADESSLYLTPSGILSLPISIDPLVMYWNKDLFASVGIATHPNLWGEFTTLIPKLTIHDDSGNINQSAVALGEFRNIQNAKEILATILMQAGTPITVRSGNVISQVLDKFGTQNSLPPGETAVNFFTEFGNPVKPNYSWNRALPNSLDDFTSGKLAMYFGFSSELPYISAKNPNLNFDVAGMPQAKSADSSSRKITFGKMYAFGLVKNSVNANFALSIISSFTNNTNASTWMSISGIPPARRDLLANKPVDAHLSLFFDSAIMSEAFLDPDTAQTYTIFKDMVEGVSTGQFRTSAAVSRASLQLGSLLAPYGGN